MSRPAFHAAAAALSFTVGAIALRPSYEGVDAALTLALLAAAHALAFELFRAPRLELSSPGFHDGAVLALAGGCGSVLAALAASAIPAPPPRQVLLTEGALYVVLLSAGTALLYLRTEDPPSTSAKRTLVLNGDDARAMVAWLRKTANRGIEPVGWIENHPDRLGDSIDGLPVLGSVAQLPYLVDWHGVEAVLALPPPHAEELRARLEEAAETAAVELILRPPLASWIGLAR